ncbi:MAG: hypothetical protein R3F43_24760 [bacterium]
MAAYKRALAIGPHNQTALAGVERVLTRRAAWDELVRFHEDRLAIAPPAERHAIYARIAEIQAEKQHNVAAARGTERVMRRSATARGRSTQALERVYIESNRWEDLAGLYERRLKVIAEGAPERSLRTTLATIYADKLGELDKAIEILEPLIGADDVDHQEIRETLETLLVLHERREDWRGSIEVLKRLAKPSDLKMIGCRSTCGSGASTRTASASPCWRPSGGVRPLRWIRTSSALVAIDALHAKIKSEYDENRRRAEAERARLEAEEAERAAKARAEAEARALAEQAAQPAAAPVTPRRSRQARRPRRARWSRPSRPPPRSGASAGRTTSPPGSSRPSAVPCWRSSASSSSGPSGPPGIAASSPPCWPSMTPSASRPACAPPGTTPRPTRSSRRARRRSPPRPTPAPGSGGWTRTRAWTWTGRPCSSSA